jgi:hypothetical protein
LEALLHQVIASETFYNALLERAPTSREAIFMHLWQTHWPCKKQRQQPKWMLLMLILMLMLMLRNHLLRPCPSTHVL